MARANNLWRTVAVLGAVVAALAVMTSAFAQPLPPHFFIGGPEGTGATIDGAAAPDGTVVSAVNQDGEEVGSTTIADGEWVIEVDSANADTVTFLLDGNTASDAQDVTGGGATVLALAATTGAAPGNGTDPGGLPNTGTGGLAGDGSSMPILPIVLLAAVVVALGGVAVTRRSLR